MRLGALAALLTLSACSPPGPPVKSPHDYLTTCAGAFTTARRMERSLAGGSPSIADPTILSAGPPTRIQCAYNDRDGGLGAYTLDVFCDDPLDHSCFNVVAVLPPQ